MSWATTRLLRLQFAAIGPGGCPVTGTGRVSDWHEARKAGLSHDVLRGGFGGPAISQQKVMSEIRHHEDRGHEQERSGEDAEEDGQFGEGAFEVLRADRPREGDGVGPELFLRAADGWDHYASMARILRADHAEPQLRVAWGEKGDGRPRSPGARDRTDLKAGRFWIARAGSTVHYLVAATDSDAFREVAWNEFGTGDLNTVRLMALVNGSGAALDVRLYRPTPDACCSALRDGRAVAGNSPNGLLLTGGFSLRRRLLNDFISKKALRRVSLLQGLTGGA